MIFNARIKRPWPRDPLQDYNKAPACVVSYRLPFLRSTSPLAPAYAAPRQSHPSSLHHARPCHRCRPLVGAAFPRWTFSPLQALIGAALPRWTHPPSPCGKLRPSPACTMHCLVVAAYITGIMCVYQPPRQREIMVI
jgi:hypothetical protein